MILTNKNAGIIWTFLWGQKPAGMMRVSDPKLDRRNLGCDGDRNQMVFSEKLIKNWIDDEG